MQVYNTTYSNAPEVNQNDRKNVIVDQNIRKEKTTKSVSSSRQTGQQYANYTREGLVKDSGKVQTTFPQFNALSKYEKYFKVLNEHYTKVNEENKRFPDPRQHIRDKYFNKRSPYYVTGLTETERRICEKAELCVLRGEAPALNSGDPVILKKFGGCNMLVEGMEWNQKIRNEMNDAIHQALEENGIVIPENADLQFTVDPYDFFIRVSGVDGELARRIETALNQGENGYYLYEHISFCDPAEYGEEPLNIYPEIKKRWWSIIW